MMKVYPATIVFFFSFLGREIIEIERDKNWNVIGLDAGFPLNWTVRRVCLVCPKLLDYWSITAE